MPESLAAAAQKDWSLPMSTVDQVLGSFDFHRVHVAMTALDWQWGSEGVPSLERIFTAARDLLVKVATEDPWKPQICICSGGFIAARASTLTLSFEIAANSASRGPGIVDLTKDFALPESETAPLESMRDVARVFWQYLCKSLDGHPGSVPMMEEGTNRPMLTRRQAEAYLDALCEGLCRHMGWPCLPAQEIPHAADLHRWLRGLHLPHPEFVPDADQTALLEWFAAAKLDASLYYSGRVQLLALGAPDAVEDVLSAMLQIQRHGMMWSKLPEALMPLVDNDPVLACKAFSLEERR